MLPDWSSVLPDIFLCSSGSKLKQLTVRVYEEYMREQQLKPTSSGPFRKSPSLSWWPWGRSYSEEGRAGTDSADMGTSSDGESPIPYDSGGPVDLWCERTENPIGDGLSDGVGEAEGLEMEYGESELVFDSSDIHLGIYSDVAESSHEEEVGEVWQWERAYHNGSYFSDMLDCGSSAIEDLDAQGSADYGDVRLGAAYPDHAVQVALDTDMDMEVTSGLYPVHFGGSTSDASKRQSSNGQLSPDSVCVEHGDGEDVVEAGVKSGPHDDGSMRDERNTAPPKEPHTASSALAELQSWVGSAPISMASSDRCSSVVHGNGPGACDEELSHSRPFLKSSLSEPRLGSGPVSSSSTSTSFDPFHKRDHMPMERRSSESSSWMSITFKKNGVVAGEAQSKNRHWSGIL